MAAKVTPINKSFALPFPQSLTEKYQPRAIEDFTGLPKVKAVVRAILKAPRKCALLFHGPSGRGKTTMALAIRDKLNAELHHIPAKNCTLQVIEDTIYSCHRFPWVYMGPGAGQPCHWHLVLVDELNESTDGAQLALLSKTDATAWPPNTIFIFTANSTEKLEPRLLSRMMQLDFGVDGMAEELPEYLADIAKREGLKRKMDFDRIARDCGYNVRDAVTKLELEILGAGYLADGYESRKVRGK